MRPKTEQMVKWLAKRYQEDRETILDLDVASYYTILMRGEQEATERGQKSNPARRSVETGRGKVGVEILGRNDMEGGEHERQIPKTGRGTQRTSG